MRFQINNNSVAFVDQIQVDGCLIAADLEKCDWAFFLKEKKKTIFVELKGAKIAKAISQIESTLEKTKDIFAGCEKECFVISSRVPLTGHDLRIAKMKFAKQYQATLNVKNRFHTYVC